MILAPIYDLFFYWMRNDESISKKFKSFSKQKILRCTFKHNQSIKIKGIKRRENKEDEKLKAQLNVDPSNCPRIYHPCAMKCKVFSWPGTHHRSKSRISWHMFAHQKENIQHLSHRTTCKWQEVSTLPARSTIALLL